MTKFSLADNLNDADIPLFNDGDEKKWELDQLPEEVSILPLKNTVLFPGVVIPITVGRDKSIQLIKDAYQQESKLIGVVSQQNFAVENPTSADLFKYGTIAVILRMIRMPDGSLTAVIQGRGRFEIESYTQEEPYFRAKIKKAPELYPEVSEARAMALSLKNEAQKVIELSPNIPSEANIALHNINSFRFLVNFIASNLNLEVKEKSNYICACSDLKYQIKKRNPI